MALENTHARTHARMHAHTHTRTRARSVSTIYCGGQSATAAAAAAKMVFKKQI